MTRAPICVNSLVREDFEKIKNELRFSFLGEWDRIENMNSLVPYTLDFEPLSKCAGSCKYCFASSDTAKDIMYSREKLVQLIDECYEIGIKCMSWTGGDPLLLPYWQEMISYSAEKGMSNFLSTSGIISKKQAKEIVRLGDRLTSVGHHLSTVNQEAYDKSHYNPRTLELKRQGYYNLLEAGYPPERVTTCITLTRPAAETIEETIDWYVDEMGVREVLIMQFKPEGFGAKHPELEASLSDVRKAAEYRAKKLGEEYLRFGSADGDKFICRSIIGLTYTGEVIPCLTIKRPVGNIYKESLKEILERERDFLLYNFEVEGFCRECQNSDVCWGCRATAAHYTGNIRGSDPKCWMNPGAKEYYLS